MRGARPTAGISLLATCAVSAALAARWRAPAASLAHVADQGSPAASSPSGAHPRQPVRLSIEPRALPDRLVLTVRLERSSLYADLPARLQLRLPAGTTLVAGQSEQLLPPGTVAAAVVELHVEGVPTDDVVASIDIAGEGRTARGEARHRFGRPEPRLPDMARLPEARLRGGGSLGTRIRVAPTPR